MPDQQKSDPDDQKKRVIRVLEGFHNSYKIMGNILTWGGFFLIIVIATMVQGFPNGFLGGLIVGSLYAIMAGFGYRITYRDAVSARENLAVLAKGQKNVLVTSRQSTFALLAEMFLGVIGLLLVLSCFFSPCKDDPIRGRLFFILIGLVFGIDQLIRRERVKGKLAIVVVVLLGSLTIYLIGKVFSIW